MSSLCLFSFSAASMIRISLSRLLSKQSEINDSKIVRLLPFFRYLQQRHKFDRNTCTRSSHHHTHLIEFLSDRAFPVSFPQFTHARYSHLVFVPI